MEEYSSSKRSAVAAGLRLCPDQSSRIVRVSRASGGKDRHSKIYTAKGVRDRRIRLSVPTAIKFYELQDRLAFEHPSKAIDWLLGVAANAIADLPTLDCSFIEQPVVGPEPELELKTEPVTKSSSSSSSETGSVLSISRSNDHNKSREQQQPINFQGSFTELLVGGGSSTEAEMNNHPINFHAPMGMLLSEHPEMLQDHQDYDFNFYTGLARETLQSNTPSDLPCHHLHKHSTKPPLFFGTPAAPVAAFAESRFPAWGFRHSDLKEKS